MAIQNKCYNTCFYLHDRFSIRKLFLVGHGSDILFTSCYFTCTCLVLEISLFRSIVVKHNSNVFHIWHKVSVASKPYFNTFSINRKGAVTNLFYKKSNDINVCPHLSRFRDFSQVIYNISRLENYKTKEYLPRAKFCPYLILASPFMPLR
jgi:hypothetical protein